MRERERECLLSSILLLIFLTHRVNRSTNILVDKLFGEEENCLLPKNHRRYIEATVFNDIPLDVESLTLAKGRLLFAQREKR